ncbi:MAG: Transcriptional regulatory protein BaeR [Pseudomonadota bacterium]|jgi:OmpR family response regulator RpaB
MPRLLLIDDDELLAPPLTAYLQRFGFELAAVTRPSLGLAQLEAGGYDAAILDVMLPEMDGFELCRRIRRHADPAVAALPVIMLTARGELTDRVVGLEIGADDYLPKPFEPRELAARLQTILRRQARPVHAAPPPATPAPAPSREERRLAFEGLVVDALRREVLRQGEVVELTGTEFELLWLLAREPGRVYTRDEILTQLRGHEADLYTRAVDILVSRLRRKLEPLDPIKTLRNAGYSFAGVRV